MKKLFAVVIVGGAVAATAAVAAREPSRTERSEIRVDLDQVNAKIDARLHAVLGELIARRAN
ncbi:MAG: hypothetical protein IRZ16_15935 [Myxococcaceae bacterium]|nr:hypothetical protein [Myxococcaceae bacterium]